MRTSPLVILTVLSVLFSCVQDQKTPSAPATKIPDTLKAPKPTIIETGLEPKGKYIDTRYVYNSANASQVIIENSLPKGGLDYTDNNGKTYVYTVFYSKITSTSDQPIQLTIDFPIENYTLPSSLSNAVKIILPHEEMTTDKVELFNYGLPDINTLLNDNIPDPTSLQLTIPSKGSRLFYVITLFNHGVEGTVRTGFSLIENTLYYRVNTLKIASGKLH